MSQLAKNMDFKPLEKLSKDLKLSAKILGAHEARFLVDTYYQMQNNRIRSNNQVRSMSKDGEPVELLDWTAEQSQMLENQIKLALKSYAESSEIGRWAMSICGIGPVIAAGLIANIDIEKAETAGAIWRFAGIDPTIKWEKGKKRPFNANLKTLCVFKLGESFVKVSNNDRDIYGKIYAERKQLEQQRNEAGEFADQAKAKLEKYNIGKTTDAYKWYSEGKLPPAHIHARARRYAVKIFLSHFWEKWRTIEGLPVPNPFAIDILGHAHRIPVPE